MSPSTTRSTTRRSSSKTFPVTRGRQRSPAHANTHHRRRITDEYGHAARLSRRSSTVSPRWRCDGDVGNALDPEGGARHKPEAAAGVVGPFKASTVPREVIDFNKEAVLGNAQIGLEGDGRARSRRGAGGLALGTRVPASLARAEAPVIGLHRRRTYPRRASTSMNRELPGRPRQTVGGHGPCARRGGEVATGRCPARPPIPGGPTYKAQRGRHRRPFAAVMSRTMPSRRCTTSQGGRSYDRCTTIQSGRLTPGTVTWMFVGGSSLAKVPDLAGGRGS